MVAPSLSWHLIRPHFNGKLLRQEQRLSTVVAYIVDGSSVTFPLFPLPDSSTLPSPLVLESLNNYGQRLSLTLSNTLTVYLSRIFRSSQGLWTKMFLSPAPSELKTCIQKLAQKWWKAKMAQGYLNFGPCKWLPTISTICLSGSLKVLNGEENLPEQLLSAYWN